LMTASAAFIVMAAVIARRMASSTAMRARASSAAGIVMAALIAPRMASSIASACASVIVMAAVIARRMASLMTASKIARTRSVVLC
jgi:hypothetical protein